MYVDTVPAAIPPTRAADPRAAEFAKKYSELQTQIFGLVQKHRAAKDDERKRIRDQITELTTEQFDLRHLMREVEIERIKKHLREVEAKVDKREALRKEIIEKRIADLLNEDVEIQWETLPIRGAGPQMPMTTEMREMRLPDGTSRRVPVIVYRDPQPPTPLSPSDVVTPLPIERPQARPDTSPASTNFPSLVGGPAVAEAKARLDIAKRKLDRVRALAVRGVIAQSEIDEAQDEMELAQLAFERASMEFEGRKKLLEVGVRRAEVEVEKVQADLEESLSINQRSPDSLPDATIRRQTAAVEEKKLALETAEVLLELHLLGANRLENVEGIVTLDGQPVADATITFVPVNDGQGTAATGITDENGDFRLTAAGESTAEPSTGIPPADYYVGVVGAIRRETEESETGVPKKYGNPKESGLRFTVEAGRNKIHIELTTE